MDYQRGRALMQEFSDAAKEAIPSKVNNSGTADRSMQAALMKWAASGGLAEMAHTGAGLGVLGAGAAGMAAYSPTGVALTNRLLAAGPETRAALAEMIRNHVPRAVPPVAMAYEAQR
jgi:hypothetical protein